ETYSDVFTGDETWRALEVPEGGLFGWEPESTYVRQPPYFEGMSREPGTVPDIDGAHVLVWVGDSVTTDHISPAGAIRPDSPAGKYLVDHGVERKDFNSYGSRRGNHEVMVRGTFANVRLRNKLVPGSEGTWTVHVPSGDEMTIYDAAKRYLADGTRTIVLAGKEYGSGSSRDWAAKGPNLLGVRAAIAESYERIHRANANICATAGSSRTCCAGSVIPERVDQLVLRHLGASLDTDLAGAVLELLLRPLLVGLRLPTSPPDGRAAFRGGGVCDPRRLFL